MPSDLFNSLSSSAPRIAKVLAAVLSLLLLGGLAGAQIPGLQIPAASEASDQKTGSILFFNYFTSSSATPNTTNTEISITNTSVTTSVVVRLFFVDGASGASVSTFLFLTPIQTATFLASDMLPGVSGYIVAVAVSSATQCPINFNSLAGEASFKQATGHSASLDAVAIAAVSATPANCSGATTTLNFDGVSYNRVPRTVSLDNIVSRADGNDTLFILNRLGGNLTVGSNAANIGVLNGLLYDDADNVLSFTRTQATPQFVTSLTNSFPSTSPPFQTFIPAGRTGWLKGFNSGNDFGYLGASVNFNPNAGAALAAFNNGHNFTHRTLATAPNYTAPLTAPDLVVAKTHSGNFTLGGTGSYTITVTNNGTAMSPMMNRIDLSDQLPNNLTLASFNGAGWNCSGVGTAAVNCSTNVTLAAAASAPMLTLTVNVNAGTPVGTNSITNTATVGNPQEFNSGNNSSSNPTSVCSFAISPVAAGFVPAGAGSTVSVTATAGCGWTAVSNAPWITVTGGSSGTGNGTVSYTVGANSGIAPRTGTMTIAGLTFNVSQAAAGILVSTDFSGGIPPDWTVVHNGTGNYPTGAPATWTAANPCNRAIPSPFSAPFAIIDSACAVQPATQDEWLVSPLFNATGIGQVVLRFNNQFQWFAGGLNEVADVDVTTNGGSNWTNVLRMQGGNNGFPTPNTKIIDITDVIVSNPANVQIRLRYYTTAGPLSPRSPASSEASWGIDNVTVQGFTINPTSQSFSASSGAGTVSVTAGAGVSWSAVSNDLWITPDVSGGTASGSVGYTVLANTGSTPRTGTMTIAGNTFTVMQAAPGLQFYPLPRPVRLLDTRAAQGNCDSVSTPIPAGTSLTTLARVTCESITIPATAQAVVGNLTVLNQTALTGYLTIYPDGVPAPLTANMIYGPSAILSNNFTVGLSSDGRFNVFGERTIDVVVDISGYYAPPGTGGLYYHPLPKPIRLLDTRAGQGNCDSVSTPIAAGTSLTTLARTTCDTVTIPTAAQAIVGNATVINGSGQVGYLTIYPNGVPVPLAANMVYFPGQILSNAFTVSLNGSGEFNIFGERTIDMAIDVAGYYSNEASDVNGAGLLFTPLVRPLRILDTRAGQGNCDAVSTPITGGSSIAAPGRLTCESITIPSMAQTVLGNVTVINQTALAGYLTLYPDGVAQPLVANIIYFPSQILSNAFVVGLNTGTGQFRIFAERTLDAVVDVSGYFAP